MDVSIIRTREHHLPSRSWRNAQGVKGDTYALHLLVLLRRLQHGGHVVGEAELLQRLGDVVAGDGLLGLLLGDLVGLGGDEGDKLNAALYEEVAGLLSEDAARGGGQDLGYDLLNRCCGGC